LSHLKERKETNCLNCNAEVNGKYCSVCGQENIEPAESAGHLISHFFNDITHFDGKFFSSLKYLVFNPGFLSTQYRIGRRASYLNPVRMYVFTSFIFFLIFFSVYHFDKGDELFEFNNKSIAQITAMDDAAFHQFANDIDSNRHWTRENMLQFIDSVGNVKRPLSSYSSKAQYDSLLRSGAIKNIWINRQIQYRLLELDEKYHGDQKRIFRETTAIFMHSLPQMLFVSLPLFALFLKLLYWRRKEFYYVSHAIFSLHLYIFIFIVFLAIIASEKLGNSTGSTFFDYITATLGVLIFFYMYKAMRNFYGERRAKTIFKFFLLTIWLLFIIALIFAFFVVFSLLKI
jgi:hypothetical protein